MLLSEKRTNVMTGSFFCLITWQFFTCSVYLISTSKPREATRVSSVNTKSYQLTMIFDSLGSEANDAATGS